MMASGGDSYVSGPSIARADGLQGDVSYSTSGVSESFYSDLPSTLSTSSLSDHSSPSAAEKRRSGMSYSIEDLPSPAMSMHEQQPYLPGLPPMHIQSQQHQHDREMSASPYPSGGSSSPSSMISSANHHAQSPGFHHEYDQRLDPLPHELSQMHGPPSGLLPMSLPTSSSIPNTTLSQCITGQHGPSLPRSSLTSHPRPSEPPNGNYYNDQPPVTSTASMHGLPILPATRPMGLQSATSEASRNVDQWDSSALQSFQALDLKASAVTSSSMQPAMTDYASSYPDPATGSMSYHAPATTTTASQAPQPGNPYSHMYS